jgi:hypothetical protein
MKLSDVNAAVQHTGYELVKGRGYFYFWPISDATPELYDSPVMTPWLGKDLSFWVSELDFRIRSTR